jgi:hypothetical protein
MFDSTVYFVDDGKKLSLISDVHGYSRVMEN